MTNLTCHKCAHPLSIFRAYILVVGLFLITTSTTRTKSTFVSKNTHYRGCCWTHVRDERLQRDLYGVACTRLLCKCRNTRLAILPHVRQAGRTTYIRRRIDKRVAWYIEIKTFTAHVKNKITEIKCWWLIFSLYLSIICKS